MITRHAAQRILDRWRIPVNEARTYIERVICEGSAFLEKKSGALIFFWNGWKVVLASRNGIDFAVVTIANDGYYYKEGRLRELKLNVKKIKWIG
ncbi:MAG: hypothetical protein OH344_04810 [Candidatus Parvarchaeota archaeon]|nr:hypothetical protein [Candidatus Jingweiarchaeum tengchongense]